jgi:DNA-binding CsgD family transcriptional regulator
VRTLAERDIQALLSVVTELAALDDARPFPPELLHHAGELVGNADVSYCELDRARKRFIFAADEYGEHFGPQPAELDERFFSLVGQHPVCSRRTKHDDWTTVRMVTDFATQRVFERTEFWNELCRDGGSRYWMDVGITPSGPKTHVFIFNRVQRDFDERDRLLVELLQPYLQRRFDAVATAAEAAGALATLEEGADDAVSDVVLCSGNGVIEFASRKSRRLLAAYFHDVNGRLPGELLAALRGPDGVVSAERDGRRLTVRAARSAGMLLLLLGEHDARLELLTRRQLEILTQVASGATDATVGAALGIAGTTVKKHLEQIYTRLGVHTRTAATALLYENPANAD